MKYWDGRERAFRWDSVESLEVCLAPNGEPFEISFLARDTIRYMLVLAGFPRMGGLDQTINGFLPEGVPVKRKRCRFGRPRILRIYLVMAIAFSITYLVKFAIRGTW